MLHTTAYCQMFSLIFRLFAARKNIKKLVLYLELGRSGAIIFWTLGFLGTSLEAEQCKSIISN